MADEKGGFVLALVRKVGPDPHDVVARVEEIRRKNPRLGERQLAELLLNKLSWLYAGQGAVASLPGTIPGLGTAVQVVVEGGAVTADLAMLVRNLTNATLTAACIYGHDVHSPDRYAEVLVVTGMWAGVLKPAGEASARIATKVAAAAVKKIPGKVLQRINRKVGTTIVTKYGTKRGGVALGKVIPFGVGVLVGGGFNLATMRGIKRAVINYYDDVVKGDRELVMEE